MSTDGGLFAPILTTDELVAATGDRAWLQALLDVEAALAGAESDLEQATAIARQMVGRWGMSEEIGLVTVLPAEDAGPFGLMGDGTISEQTRQLLDAEVRRITDECHKRARARWPS